MALQLITQPLRTVHPNKNNSRKTTTPSPPNLKKKTSFNKSKIQFEQYSDKFRHVWEATSCQRGAVLI